MAQNRNLREKRWSNIILAVMILVNLFSWSKTLTSDVLQIVYYPEPDDRSFLPIGTKEDDDSRKRRLADGCHHVFLDVGANIGVHARFLFEPDQYPEATMARGWFDDAFGVDRDPRDMCVFSFEPNPKHKERLEGLAKAYAAMGWRYYPIFAGVSDAEGTLEFVPSRDALGRGFSARSNQNAGLRQKSAVTVPVQRLASWLLDEIEGRQLPDTVYGDYKGKAPKVVMKLDVETMEYVLLPDLLLSGALCNTVDKVFGEVHYQFFPLTFEKKMG